MARFAARVFQGALFVVLALAVAGPVRAAQDADEAQFHFVRGNQFYRQGHLEDALGEYYASDRLVPNRNVAFNIARCLEKLKRYDEAFRAWSAVGGDYLPKEEAAVIGASIERLRPHVAFLQVNTRPSGADVYLNRRDLGSLGHTPKLLALPEGKGMLIIELPGYRRKEITVELVRGKETRADATLDPILGTVALSQVPDNAEIRRNRADAGVLRRGPGSVQIPPGHTMLVVSAPGYRTVEVEVNVVPDAVTPIAVGLDSLVLRGTLVLRANVDGATVLVDGRERGLTPTVIEDLAAGERLLEIVSPGYENFQSRVQIRAGESTHAEAHLLPAVPRVSAASKSTVRTDQAPASVSVISAEDIAAFGYGTLAEALAAARGTFSSNDRSYESIGFRGFSPPGDYTSRVLVLVDGHPTNDVLTGQGYVGHDFDVDLAEVERIEIVRGPGSVLYGNAALFGVINVVTRRPAPGAHASAGTQVGSLGLSSARGTASQRGRAYEVAATGAILGQAGDRSFAWADGAGGLPATVARYADHESAVHAQVRVAVGPVTLQAGVNRRDKTVPTGAFQTRAEPGTTERDTRTWVELRFEKTVGPQDRATLFARAAYDASGFDGNYRLAPDAAGKARRDLQDAFAARWFTGELRLALVAPRGHHLTLGGEAQGHVLLDLGDPSSTAQQAANAGNELILSAYVTDDWALTEHLRLNVGLRADHYQAYGNSNLNPRAALIGQFYARGTTKVMAGRAFRAPSVYERFYGDGGVTQRQAADLVPEAIVSAELEHTHGFSDEVTAVGALFANQISGLIVLDTEAASGRPLLVYRQHDGQVRSVGAEGELRWEPAPGTLLGASYSWQILRDHIGGTAGPFPNAPEHLVALRWRRPILPRRLSLGSEVLYEVGRRDRNGDRVDDAMMANVTISGDYQAWRLRYFAGVFNLLDVRGAGSGFPAGQEIPALTVPRYGRSARVGVSWSF